MGITQQGLETLQRFEVKSITGEHFVHSQHNIAVRVHR